MKKMFTIVLAITFGLVSLNAQYWTEDFEAGLPAGWTVEGAMALTDAATLASQYYAPAEHTMFVGTNDDALGATGDGSGRLVSGMIDLTAVTSTSLILTFQGHFADGDYQGTDETAKVSVSTDAGATWTEILDVAGTGNEWRDVSAVLPYQGQQIWLSFEYQDGGGWNYGFAFDDLRIEDAPFAKELQVMNWNKEQFFSGGFAGGKVYPGATVRNLGVETITSLDFSYSDGTNTITETFTGLNIGFQEAALIETATAFILPEGTSTIGSVVIDNINGAGDDEDPSNNGLANDITITTVTPNADRGVLVEEATGTWCQWCPRGTVFMDGLTKRYPGKFVGIAVHNNDPMAVANYDGSYEPSSAADDVAFALLIGGYPSAVIERGGELDPGNLEAPFVTAVQQAPPARLNIGAEFDDATRALTLSVDAEFLEAGSGHKLTAILYEDGVTGTGTGYNQVNQYSGGGNGPMGGYEILPGSVPASQMVYDHVGRYLIGAFDGDAESLPATVEAGERHGYTFATYTIPAGVNLDNIHIAGVLLGSNNRAVNALSVTLAEAEANGIFVVGTNDVFSHNAVSVFPNPFSGTTNIKVSLESSADVTVEVMNAIGQSVFVRNYGKMIGDQNIEFDGSNLESGVYFVHVRMGEKLATQRITLSK